MLSVGFNLQSLIHMLLLLFQNFGYVVRTKWNLFFICSCVHMCTWVHMQARSQYHTASSFPPLPPPAVSLWARSSGRLRDPPISAFPVLELQVHKATPGFLHSVKDLNSWSYICKANTLTTKLFPHPKYPFNFSIGPQTKISQVSPKH